MKGVKVVFSLVILISLISFVSALTCNPTFFSATYQEENIPTDWITITNCNNLGGNLTNITLEGSVSYFELYEDFIGNSKKDIKIKIDQNIPPAFYPFSLAFDNLPLVSGIIIIEESEPPEPRGCDIDVFPTVLSNLKVQQGEKKTRQILLTIPSCYPDYVDVRGVILQTGEKPILLGELAFGRLQPGDSVTIPIEIDAIGVSTGTYSDTLEFNLANSSGIRLNVPSVSISVLVTTGISPISNFSLQELPSCSLDAIEMSLNNTYKLTCSFNNPNIDIHPLIDQKYIKGIKVTPTNTQYIYEFQPILIGITTIGAEFLYKNAPLGTPFLQEVRITPSGSSPTSGITTRFEFYQSGIKKTIENLFAGETIVNVLDDKTGNLLTDVALYLNGVPTNKTINLELKSYELRATVSGYLDNLVNFTISEQTPLQIILEPDKSVYEPGETINITSNIEGASFTLDDSVISSPYTLSAGTFVLKAFKEGYTETNRTIIVQGNIYITASSPQKMDDWKKGKNILVELSNSTSWKVDFGEAYETETGFIDYLDPVTLFSGEGNKIEFKMEEYGKYHIKSGEQILTTKILEKGSFSFLGLLWYFWIIILVVGGGIIYLLFFKGKEPEKGEKLVFSPKPSEG